MTAPSTPTVVPPTPLRCDLLAGESFTHLRAMPDDSCDALVTDPPYSSGGFTRGDRTLGTVEKYQQNGQLSQWAAFGGDSRDQRGFLAWSMVWLAECWRVLKPGAPVMLFTDWRQLPVTTDALQAGDFVWRGIIPWNKGEGVRPQMGRPRAQAEYVVWGSKGPMPQRVDVGVRPGAFPDVPETPDDYLYDAAGNAYPPTLFASVAGSEKWHLTGKPVALMRELVRVCPPGGLVLDPFAGSASTGVACVIERRGFVGMERDPHYVEVGSRRLAHARHAPHASSEQPSMFEGMGA